VVLQSWLSSRYKKSVRTLQRYFDALDLKADQTQTPDVSLNLIFDATFFSRSDGILVFRANQSNLHWQFISSETLAEIEEGLLALKKKGIHRLMAAEAL